MKPKVILLDPGMYERGVCSGRSRPWLTASLSAVYNPIDPLKLSEAYLRV